jgi:hypothetical protein
MEAAGIDVLEGGNLLDMDELKGIGSDSTHDSIQMYLREIGQYPLISGEDERELAKRIEKGDMEAGALLLAKGQSSPRGFYCEKVCREIKRSNAS